MKYFEKTINNEYDVALTSFGNDISEFDQAVFEKVASEKDELFQKAQSHIEEVIDKSNPIFEGGLKLNAIDIIGTSERSYSIELECYYKNDQHMYWSVTFNLPLMKADMESLAKSKYWPIELKRRVE